VTTVPRTTPTGTVVRSTIRIRLGTYRGNVALPRPTCEHGGLTPVPAGHGAQVDIGKARYIDPYTAMRLADVLRAADRIEVIGDDHNGVRRVSAAIAPHLTRRERP
jgi:hypothetical protein